MAVADIFERAKLLNCRELRAKRPVWTDRLPLLMERPSAATRPLVRWHWSFLVPKSLGEVYLTWLARRSHRRNLEQIEIDELNEISEVTMIDDSSEAIRPVFEKHRIRREASRFGVVARERRRVERLAKRWDVDIPRIVYRGVADEQALARTRRAIRDARWTFFERCAKTLIPVLSLLVALVALLQKN